MRATTGWLRFDAAVANDLAGSMYEWGNMLFALDLSAFVLTITRLRDERAAGQAMFQALGRIDAMCSIATWRGLLGSWTTPRFTEAGKRLHAESVVHPLLDAGVPNDIRIDDSSVLVTGSNMSGKTTFLRALGVNAILAQSVGTVCAGTWSAPVLHVRTSIGQGDSLLDGKSYYMAEIESVKRMLDVKSDMVPHLFLLDELFRGTNTPERIAAGAATLAWLDRGHDLVLVATHDLELHALLDDRFVACHFREEVTDSALTFDFRIRPGVSSTRNAIALLRLIGYPADLLDEAHAVLNAGTAAPTRHCLPGDG
jgi:DNA mismatch repair ATPase MutS